MTDQITDTADVRELAREIVEGCIRNQVSADQCIAALDAKGIGLCGPGMVVMDEEDFSFLWRAVKAAEALRDDVQWPRPSLQPHALNISFIGEALTVLDNVRAALGAGAGQDGEGVRE